MSIYIFEMITRAFIPKNIESYYFCFKIWSVFPFRCKHFLYYVRQNTIIIYYCAYDFLPLSRINEHRLSIEILTLFLLLRELNSTGQVNAVKITLTSYIISTKTAPKPVTSTVIVLSKVKLLISYTPIVDQVTTKNWQRTLSQIFVCWSFHVVYDVQNG